MYSEITTVRFSPATRAFLRDYAEQNDLKEATTIRVAVKRFITEQQEIVKRLKRKPKK
jgi:hypothetical protein